MVGKALKLGWNCHSHNPEQAFPSKKNTTQVGKKEKKTKKKSK